VRFPPLYLAVESAPWVRVVDAMVTDASAVIADDKPLMSCAIVDEDAMVEAMLQEAAGLAPDPCVYQMGTWLTENAFTFISVPWE
jgi:hypothetical protein